VAYPYTEIERERDQSMKSVLRVGMSIIGSIVLSTLASWALRRLLWSAAAGREQGERRAAPVLVAMPIFVGNQWVIGQPRQPATPSGQSSNA